MMLRDEIEQQIKKWYETLQPASELADHIISLLDKQVQVAGWVSKIRWKDHVVASWNARPATHDEVISGGASMKDQGWLIERNRKGHLRWLGIRDHKCGVVAENVYFFTPDSNDAPRFG
jgi:hypothetical protein